MLRFQYMKLNQTTADVEVDYSAKTVVYRPYTEDVYALPFGVNKTPTIADVVRFLESRCFPKERSNCKQILKDLGLDEYTPLEIVRKTHGRQYEDFCWVKFDGEVLDYEADIKLRD